MERLDKTIVRTIMPVNNEQNCNTFEDINPKRVMISSR